MVWNFHCALSKQIIYFCKSPISAFYPSLLPHRHKRQFNSYYKCKKPTTLSSIVPHQQLGTRDKIRQLNASQSDYPLSWCKYWHKDYCQRPSSHWDTRQRIAQQLPLVTKQIEENDGKCMKLHEGHNKW